MHAPNHGCLVKVTVIDETGEECFDVEGYLALSYPRINPLDTGLVLVELASDSPVIVYTTDRIELVNARGF